MLPFEGYSGGATSPPPSRPHSSPISPQLLPRLRAPWLAPARGSGSALPGFSRPTTNDGEAGSSGAGNAVARRKYGVVNIERARLVRQASPAPGRPQGVQLPPQGPKACRLSTCRLRCPRGTHGNATPALMVSHTSWPLSKLMSALPVPSLRITCRPSAHRR
jgi:hypothetical protein